MSQTMDLYKPGPAVELLHVCAELQSLLQELPKRRPATTGLVEEIEAQKARILALHADDTVRLELNDEIRSARECARPFTYRQRWQTIAGVTARDNAWCIEVQEAAKFGIAEADLKYLRKNTLKHLARQKNHPVRSVALHPLASDTPFDELVAFLHELPSIDVGRNNRPAVRYVRGIRKQRPPKLSRDQAEELRGAITRYRCFLTSATILLLNLFQADGTFRLSYSLAVGQLCLG